MKNYIISSKLFVPRSPMVKTIFIVLNIVLILAFILAAVSIFMGGASWVNIGTIVFALAIVFRTKRLIDDGGTYQTCFTNASFDNDVLKIIYYKYLSNNQLVEPLCEVVIPLRSILSLEYSDRLMCLRIVGDVSETFNNKSTTARKEHLYYLNEIENVTFLSDLQNLTNLRIKYMDRI